MSRTWRDQAPLTEALLGEARRFDEALRDPRAAQRELLRRVLATNAATEIGRRHGFAEIGDEASYAARVPLCTYADFAGMIDRMLAGERDVLIAGAPAFFARTSGTSGKPKHIPLPVGVAAEYMAAVGPHRLSIERVHPGSARAVAALTGRHLEDRSPGGVAIGSASGYMRNLSDFDDARYFRFAPEAVMESVDLEARYYALLRFALAMPLRTLGALNPGTLLVLFGKAERHAEDLAADLREGTLRRGPPGVPALGAACEGELRPEPAAADRLLGSLRAHGRFMPEEVWPELEVINTWKGGASVHYLSALSARFPKVTIRAAMSGSTESVLAIPLTDDWQGGVPALRSSYYEFLPVRADDDMQVGAPVPLTELDDRGAYRLAITNGRGLYRYLMEDVFQIEGRHHGVPVIRFSHRCGMTSSLTGEKLTAGDVCAGVEAALGELPLPLVDYQVAPEWGEPPRYLLLVEVGREVRRAEAERFLGAYERCVTARNMEYRDKRASGRLGPPELILLARDSFVRLRAELAKGRSDAQVKIPQLRRELARRAELSIVPLSD